MSYKFLTRFDSLQTRLTLTYTMVTVGTLLVVEILLFTIITIILFAFDVPKSEYLRDVYIVLKSQSERYLAEGDVEGLQNWMENRFALGIASEPPLYRGDSPAAPFDLFHNFYALDTSGTIIAQAPEPDSLGEPYNPPFRYNEWFSERLSNPDNPIFTPLKWYQPIDSDTWFVVVPLASEVDETHLGFLVLYIQPVPFAASIAVYLQIFGGVVLATVLILILGVTPFGAIFGYFMARSFTRRLSNLKQLADAYSQGDFDVETTDHSRDEIGQLGQDLKQMAERLQILLESREELATLEERNRLARDLHDTVKQQNFATLMQIRAAKNLTQQVVSSTSAIEHLDMAEDLLKQSQQDLKTIIDKLRPAQLHSLGLVESLEKLTSDWSNQTRITVNLSVQGERDTSLEIEQALYRVVQEALANIARHSQAKNVLIRLQYTSQGIALTIQDDGIGFSISEVSQGFGLTTMRQRIAEISGTFDIGSSEVDGTTIRISVPYANQYAN